MTPQTHGDDDLRRVPARLAAVATAARGCASALRALGTARWDRHCWTAPGEPPMSTDERAALRRAARPGGAR